jgi:formate dehydrogenase gamma subunit
VIAVRKPIGASILAGPAAFLAFVLLAPPARAEDCLACHGDASLTMQRKGRTISLRVDPAALARSPHKGLACTSCHAGFKEDALPHLRRILPVGCLSCHADAPKRHTFHPQMEHASGRGGSGDASCKSCHGTHAVLSPKNPDSPLHSPKLAASCGTCHGDVVEQYAASVHGKALAAGTGGAPDCLVCHQKPVTATRAGGRTADLKIAQARLCLGCHLDSPEVRARTAPSAGFIAAYETSVHGAALHRGNQAAATCIDCHGSHEIQQGFEPASRINKRQIPHTCGSCHDAIAREYAGSVHGVAVAKGSRDAPACTDCHGEHNILLHTDPNAPVAPANVSAKVCSPCHSSLRLSQKYALASDRFTTFADSYHGLAILGGAARVANCASCHGAHAILPSADPASSIHKTHLAETCGKCHPGANARFAVGPVHVVTTESQQPLLYWISTLYIVVIVLVVGGMLIHNALDFIRKSVRRFRVRSGQISEAPISRALYLRMSVSERLQHAALLLSFTVLVITGFMLRYPDAWWVAGLRRLSDHLFDLRSLLHRIAGVVMVAASCGHVAYLALTARGRQLFRDMLPRRGDLSDIVGVAFYNLGLRSRRPRFGRFSYVEKSEYWALVWGTSVMIVSGVVLWFDNTFMGLLTKLGLDVARTIHFYEAVLASLAILVWHIYFVIFNPDVYPMNLAWLTGTLSEEEMAAEHPLELEAIRRRQPPRDPPAKTPTPGGDRDTGHT